MTHSCGVSGRSFEIWFRRRRSQDTYILQAETRDVKEAWTRDLERILWEQALKSRGQSTLQNNTEYTRHLQEKIKWLQVTVHIVCACTFL